MSGFVKLDCGILRSTIWVDRDARDLFLTALLMAEPREFTQPVAQVEVRTLATTGWVVPPGWYGFVPAAGIGIINAAGIADREVGLAALERMGAPEEDSRSTAYDGRRMVRVDGGYVILNYMVYREKDHTSAERSRRYREQKRTKSEKPSRRHAVTPRPARDATRDITQAEAQAEAQAEEEEAASVTPIRIPMTAAWQPKPETLAAFEVAMIEKWAVTELVSRFRAHFASNSQELSTDIEWNQRCSKWVFRDWGNPSRRPLRPKLESKAAGAQRAAEYQARLKAEAAARHAELAAEAETAGLDVSAPLDLQNMLEAVGE